MGCRQIDDKSFHEIKSGLRELCAKMIYILGKVKDSGIITENEYAEHIILKKTILN